MEAAAGEDAAAGEGHHRESTRHEARRRAHGGGLFWRFPAISLITATEHAHGEEGAVANDGASGGSSG